MGMKAWLVGCLLLLVTQAAMLAQDYNVLSFGAVPDAKTLNTRAIQATIDQAHADGGGRVIVPAGRFALASFR